jgi:hypothetical protein
MDMEGRGLEERERRGENKMEGRRLYRKRWT